MIDVVFAEYHDLLPIFHKPLRILMHTVHKYLIIEVFLHSGDIDYSAVSQFLELGIVDVGAVHRRYLVAFVMARGEHERVVGSRRCELHVAGHTLVGIYYRMDFDAAFLPACLRMTSHALEHGIGEQGHSS